MKNLGIGVRLGIGFGVVLLLSILMTVYGTLRLQDVASRTHEMMQEPLAKERIVSDWYRLMYASVRRTTAVARSSDPRLAHSSPRRPNGRPIPLPRCATRSSRC